MTTPATPDGVKLPSDFLDAMVALRNHGEAFTAEEAEAAIRAALEQREAEVEYARATIADAIDTTGIRDEPLRTLATRASNALYWRSQAKQEAEARATAAESRLGECMELLKALYDAASQMVVAETETITYADSPSRNPFGDMVRGSAISPLILIKARRKDLCALRDQVNRITDFFKGVE